MRYASVRSRLDPILPTVEKPGRYVGLERNVVRKDLRASAVTVALAFPDTYEIGMSHTGLKILYEIVNRRPDFACERTYAPWVDLEGRMRGGKIPLFTVESFSPVADFDVVGFSLQSELNYSNIPNMLDLARIPVWQRDRGDSDPIVLAVPARRTPSRSPTSSTRSWSATRRKRSPASWTRSPRRARPGSRGATSSGVWRTSTESTCPRSTT